MKLRKASITKKLASATIIIVMDVNFEKSTKKVLSINAFNAKMSHYVKDVLTLANILSTLLYVNLQISVNGNNAKIEKGKKS